jgi:acyl CoA:acetate/3-ketoacid CoA transferase
MYSKIVDIAIISQIKDNSVVGISGFNMATTSEYLILGLYKRYKEQGHPKNLFIISDALPAIPGRGLDQVAESLYKDENQERSFIAVFGFFPRAPEDCDRQQN